MNLLNFIVECGSTVKRNTVPKFGVMVLPNAENSSKTCSQGPKVGEKQATVDMSHIIMPSEVKARVKAKLRFIGKLLPSSSWHRRKVSITEVKLHKERG